MREQRCKFRVLGLSATPGSDGAKVQASAAWRCRCRQPRLRLLQHALCRNVPTAKKSTAAPL
jgi:hypothetical protein